MLQDLFVNLALFTVDHYSILHWHEFLHACDAQKLLSYHGGPLLQVLSSVRTCHWYWVDFLVKVRPPAFRINQCSRLEGVTELLDCCIINA